MITSRSASSGERIAHHAVALIGAPFRLHGREPATGLDCVGLVSAVLVAAGASPVAPQGYRLHNASVLPWLAFARRSGLAVVSDRIAPGDVLLLGLSSVQQHLTIAVGQGDIVHAHAGLRRVVRQRLDPSASILTRWRLLTPLQG